MVGVRFWLSGVGFWGLGLGCGLGMELGYVRA